MEGYWKIYFETLDVSLEDVIQFVKKLKFEKQIWYFHPYGNKGKGPHVHALVAGGTVIDDSIRNAIKKFIPRLKEIKQSFAVSNTFERGTKMNEDNIGKYVTYMSKGKYDPVYNDGFESDWVDVKKHEWKEPTSLRVGDLTIIANEVRTKPRMTQVACARLAYERYQQTYADADVNVRKLIRIVADVCKEHNFSRSYRNVQAIVQDVMCDLSYQRWENKIYDSV